MDSVLDSIHYQVMKLLIFFKLKTNKARIMHFLNKNFNGIVTAIFIDGDNQCTCRKGNENVSHTPRHMWNRNISSDRQWLHV